MHLFSQVAVRLEGDLSAEQRARLLGAAQHCPVKRMLLGQMQGGVTVVGGDFGGGG